MPVWWSWLLLASDACVVVLAAISFLMACVVVLVAINFLMACVVVLAAINFLDGLCGGLGCY